MLRDDEEMKNIPVIFLTGRDDKQSVMSVMELKPQGYFIKSIKRDELLMKLKTFFMNQDQK
jgi:DNA-binding NarL/FixJ family response regulator